jgi:uncharacterized phage protein gp47/JayE
LRAQAAADVSAALPGVDALLRYSNVGILADINAALANGHYGYLDWIAKQCTPFTASDEYLEGWAGLKAVIRKAATVASGSAQFVATTGSIVPGGTPLTRRDGAVYTTTADGTAADGLVTVPFVAALTGASGDATAGTAMTLGVAYPGVTSTGVCVGPITGGADIESDNNLRTRMLLAYAAPAQGGTFADYQNWALQVPGVTRAWGGRSMGVGTVTVYIMLDDVRAAQGGFPQGSNGCATQDSRDIPATGDQLLVADAIFLIQPSTPIIYVVAPIPNGLTFTIAGLASASTEVKAAVQAALAKALLFGAAPGGTVNVIYLESAIASVAGAGAAVLTNISATAGTITPGTAGNIISNPGALAILSDVVFP